MGKQNFPDMYRKAHKALGSPRALSYRVSAGSDEYDEDGKFAGIMLYHHDGEWEWYNQVGIMGGHRSHFGQVFIQRTEDWPQTELYWAGKASVHDYLYRQIFVSDSEGGRTCCAGFAVINGERRYSSMRLNNQQNSNASEPWLTDGSKYLADWEIAIIDLVLDAWEKAGSGITVEAPSLHDALMGHGDPDPKRLIKLFHYGASNQEA